MVALHYSTLPRFEIFSARGTILHGSIRLPPHTFVSSRGCSLAINITWQQHHNRFSSKSNFSIFFGNAFHYRYFGCLSSAMWSFTKMYTRNFKISLNFYKKGIHFAWTEDRTKCRQICYFLDVSEKFLSLTCFSNDLYTLYKWLNASRLVRFWKTWKHANQGINTALSSFNNCNFWGFFHRNSD